MSNTALSVTLPPWSESSSRLCPMSAPVKAEVVAAIEDPVKVDGVFMMKRLQSIPDVNRM